MFGVPELAILSVIAMYWLVPVAAAAWALITLRQMRRGQEAMRATLERIEQHLRTR